MLTFRFAMVSTAAGLALWALFSLLDALREPGMLSADSRTVIKGCEVLDNEETRAVCPQLFCQQAVIETRQVSHKSRFAVTVDKQAEGKRYIGGNVSGKDPSDPAASFMCVIEDARIVNVKVTNRAGLAALAARPVDDWAP